MSGLAAGIRLAHFGHNTLILERHYRTGGLNSWYRMAGRFLDTGLHAITNYSPHGPRNAPMARLFRQLRLRPEDFALAPQRMGRIVFPGAELEFDNDFERLSESVARVFPREADNFQRLVRTIREYDDLDLEKKPESGREAVRSIIGDPLLADMIMMPVMFYGSSQEDDMELGQFAVVFKGVFLEGLARPEGGIRRILDALAARYEAAGGRMRLRTGVEKITVENGRVAGVVTDDGERIECGAVLSSAGLMETAAVCPEARPDVPGLAPGRISLMESINALDAPAAALGAEESVVFYSNTPTLRYRRPDGPADVDSGVICYPENFDYGEPLKEGMVRISNLADYGFWMGAEEMEYREAKKEWHSRSLAAATSAGPDIRGRITFSDVFTPRTIHRYTGHINGALYGAPMKMKNGRTPVENLYITGTDQGFLGIVGAMLSGVTVANIHMMSSARRG